MNKKFDDYCKKLNMEFSDSTKCCKIAISLVEKGNQQKIKNECEKYVKIKNMLQYEIDRYMKDNSFIFRFLTNISEVITAHQLCREFLENIENPDQAKKYIS